MSARKLYFTTSSMHFVCGDRVHRAEYPHALERETFAEVGKYSIKDNFGLEEILKMEDTDEIYQEWVYWVVMGYGNRQTTNPTDAFPSLSGLAHMFAPLLWDEYVAGLWAKRLASGLLWECEEPDGTLESLVSYYSDPGTASSYIGPSWTWVARGIVHQETSSFYMPDFVDECESLNAVCMPKGSDPCGELRSASLHDDTVVDFRLRREARGPSIRCVFDFQTGAEDEDDDGDGGEDQAEEEGQEGAGEEGEEAEDAEALQGCLFILMASYYCHQYESWKLAGLIVHPVDDDDDEKGDGARFIRIGRFTAWFESSEQDIAAIREIFGQHGARDFEII
ncbi:heterokaryon incompatibility protein-domain-containing protein [Apiospora aurea]|uniref:Heterokaryon incompatibility protein-domain-containing protein n=1 Tax=Apiospora aurea TaxID=335848 RepID=A0ABR1R194_9PEZI